MRRAAARECRGEESLILEGRIGVDVISWVGKSESDGDEMEFASQGSCLMLHKIAQKLCPRSRAKFYPSIFGNPITSTQPHIIEVAAA